MTTQFIPVPLDSLIAILRDERLSWSCKSVVIYLAAQPAAEKTLAQIEQDIHITYPTLYRAIEQLLSHDLVTRDIVYNGASLRHATIKYRIAPDYLSLLHPTGEFPDLNDAEHLVEDSSPGAMPEELNPALTFADHLELPEIDVPA
jgi:hypothetical protein